VDATSAFVISMNVFVTLFMVPYGGHIGTAVTVGRSMGEGQPKNARIYIKIALVLILIIDFMIALGLIANKSLIGPIFTSNQGVLLNLENVFDTMAIVLIFHGV
jgi:Na+-driven multidrug efflux pump